MTDLKKINITDTTEQPDPYQLYCRPLARLFEVYISQPFNHHTEQYIKLFDMLRSATPNDIIRININSPGGSLVTGLQLLNSMRECEAHIITVLDGEAFSLAPLVLLAGDEIIINDHSAMMFHNYSWGTYGKGNETGARQAASDRQYASMLKAYATPFLTNDEIDRVLRGEDLYYDTGEILDRLDKVKEEKDREEEKQLHARHAQQERSERLMLKAEELLRLEDETPKKTVRRSPRKKTTKE